jgi:hypothetical protein
LALTCLDAVLAALPSSGMTLQLLREVARAQPDTSAVDRQVHLNMAAAALGITAPADIKTYAQLLSSRLRQTF